VQFHRQIKQASGLATAGLFTALVATTASAQGHDGASLIGSAGDPSKIAHLVYTDNRPTIDAILDDEVWKTATIIDDLHQVFPADGAEPSQKTVYKLAYDEDALYIAVYVYETDPSLIVAKEMIQGSSIREDDNIQIVLDPYLSFRSGYSFFINANGILAEGLFEGRDINANWEGIWYGEARVVEDGWIAEIEIPFKTISFDDSITSWGFTVGRRIVRAGERNVWASKNRESGPSAAGILTGIEKAEQGMGLDLVPSFAVRSFTHDTYLDTGAMPPVVKGGLEQTLVIPSINAYYKLTPSITAALTANTDFSGSDVDDVVINLSQFSVFFPEKRAFFLQDADIFSFGSMNENGIPFFSRKIGLASDATPVDIVVGEKVSGRIGDWNIGVMHVLQDMTPTVGQSDLMVARASVNILAESNAGFISTYGDPLSDNDNALMGADFSYRSTSLIKGKAAEASAWYQITSTDGEVSESQAYGGKLGIFARDGLFWAINHKTIEENFYPALGFVNRTNIHDTEMFGGYKYRPSHPMIREVTHSFFTRNVMDLDGNLLLRIASIQPFEIINSSGDSARLRIRHIDEIIMPARGYYIWKGVFISPGEYENVVPELVIQTSLARDFSWHSETQGGGFYDGDHLRLFNEISWQANRNIFLGIGLSHTDVNLPAGKFISRIATARLNIAFTSKIAWLNFVQYDNFSNTAALNSRLKWQPRPGDEYSVIVNYGADIDDDGIIHDRKMETIVKAVRTFRF
jgi:hypothetical protein